VCFFLFSYAGRPLCPAKFEADTFFSFKSYLGVKNFEIGSRDPGHAHLGVVLNSLRRRGLSSVSLPNLKRIAQFVQKLLRGPEIRKLGHVNPDVLTYGRFMVHTQGGSVLYVCTEFEARSSFRSKSY